MNDLVRRIVKFLAYTAAGVVIVLAIGVGLFRLFLPRLPEYQDEIKAWASEAIGMQVEFSGMDARWGLSGPELAFYDTELIRRDGGARLIAAEEIRVGIGFLRLLSDRTLIVDRLVIRNTGIDILEPDDGRYRVQGIPVEELLNTYAGGSGNAVDIEIIGENIELRFMQPGDERPHFFEIPRVRASVDDHRIAVDAGIELPDTLGRELRVSATQVLSAPVDDRRWDLAVDGDSISLAGWSELAGGKRFLSGSGDLELALAVADSGVSSAVVELDFADVAVTGDDVFDVSGRVEVDVSDSGWLVAANRFSVEFQDHAWPESMLRIEAVVDASGSVVMLDSRASYLRLDDLAVIEPWLNARQRQLLADFAPSGVIRQLVATVSDIGSEDPQFSVSAELDRIGIRDTAERPGIRGFSGLLRANSAGGRLEIDAVDFEVRIPEYLSETVAIDAADGTVIWRNSNDRTTVLSDSIAIESSFFNSQNNVQLVLNKDGSSPEIDLASTWNMTDLALAKRYIPRKGLPPRLYDWFQMALVSGSISRGTTSLKGPLDKFPFDGGEGRLLIEASVRNMTFQYHREWPPAEQADLEVVLDNARLYSERNRSISAGNSVVDAAVEIADLRDPVLTIDSFSTGTLESIRDFSMRSPIARVFGGQLDRIAVSGEASFTLDLIVPLKKERLQEFEFVSRVRSNNGTLSVAGFDPPLSDLIGEVTIERERVSSEGLGASFLGQPVSISLTRSTDPRFSVLASAEGTLTAEAVVNDLGVPLEGIVSGATPYRARMLFPNARVETPPPLTIQIDSGLDGLALELPEPLGKAADETLAVSTDIRLLPGGEFIESAGVAENRMAWQLAFNRPEGPWDFDRGVVTMGAAVTEVADTRGLHIRGTTGVVRLQDWLNLSRSGEKSIGAADRIRSIDLLVEDLYLVGQHLRDHRIRVDRSARDWLVQFDGDDVVGSAFVPYDFGGDRAMVLDMQRLYLPGDEDSRKSVANIDPRNLPPLQLSAADFAFGDRYLGAVEATLEKTENGLEATSLSSEDASYGIAGTGRWEADDDDPYGSRSFIAGTLSSTDVKETMTRLNYQPGISGNDMRIVFDLDWSGAPRAEFFDVLNGTIQVRLVDGQLEEVKPGAGRVFGLMSIVALPRRLSLDFRDVFSKGFGFDKIAGSFRIEDGRTYTCDLSLEGPAADIGIIGEVNLAAGTYDQTAIVSANVGNTLPIVGAVVAGPQAAAVLLVFSQIFKKPLQEVGQTYYSINGPWDEPLIDSAREDAFVASGELAGCLAGEEGS